MKYKLVLAFLLSISTSIWSQNYDSFFTKGNKEFDQKDYKSAIADYTKAIEINPKLTEAYCNRGLAKSMIFDYKGAIIDFTKSIKINHNHAKS